MSSLSISTETKIIIEANKFLFITLSLNHKRKSNGVGIFCSVFLYSSIKYDEPDTVPVYSQRMAMFKINIAKSGQLLL